MTSRNRWHSILALAIVGCMLALPMSVFANKGKEHFTEGMKYEQAQQWEKAAQEFTLAMAADPSNVDYQLHYRRAVFNASQAFMQQGRSLAEQRDYVGAYNAFRQAFGYDPVNQLAVSEMERMLRLEQVKQGLIVSNTSTTNDANAKTDDALGGGTPSQPQTRTPEADVQLKPEIQRTINFNGVDIKNVIKQLALDLNLNVMFDRQSFAQPRPVDLNLQKVTTAKALDLLFLQENLFFQKLDKRTVLVADQSRRPQYQQLVVRTFFIANSDPDKIKGLLTQALPASVGRPQPIVVSDKDTNSLTVRDTAENVKLIGELLESLDKDRAEVVMDVNIYEVSRSNLLQFGNQLGDSGSLTTLGGIRSFGSTLGQLTQVVTGTGAAATGLPLSFGAALLVPSSALQAFASKNNARLLASTQIHAFNNEESSARIGQRVPVQTAQAFPFGVQTGTTTTATPNQPFGGGGFPVINYEPTGLTLSFTPIVFPNLDVQVKMKIESKDVSGASTLTPTFTERTLQGTARVQNNRTMMLASVSQNVESNGRQGLPILSGLPILGRLFTSPTRDNRQVDIVIAVTPRVLRAPAVTPRDEEMRPSGTLQAPTTGSLEAMLRETERDEQIAAARRLPKDAVIQVPDAAPAYEPAVKTDAGDQAKVSEQQTAAKTAPVNTSAPTNVAALQMVSTTPATEANRVAASIQTDASMPQPKSAAITTSQNPPVLQTADVSTALKSLVSAPTNVSTTSLSAKQETVLTPVTDVAMKSESNSTAANSAERATSLIEVGVTPDKSELKVGEKQQLQLRVKSDAPLGLALVMLRFDPKVMKVNSVSMGDLFANAKTPPTLTQSIDNHGMILISLVPAAGSAVTADGTIFNIEVEALAAGDSTLMFDLSNVNVVASDGRPLLLKLEPIKLTVK